MRFSIILSCWLAADLSNASSRETDPVFNIKKILAPSLDDKVLKRSEKNGIVTEEVKFHSETDGDKKVDIFGYFSYPKNAKKLPGLIWNQGGLYKATTYWTEFGAKRGYATLCIDFPLPGYRSTGAYPITSGLELGDDPTKVPIYHGAVALLRAVSFLESRLEVDTKRIGMAGSSWGGFYTTLMAGIDPRLKAASSMFGCGGLHLGNLWWDGNGWDAKRTKQFRSRWKKTLDPALRLQKSKTPIAWFTGTNDQFYWLPGLMESYQNAAGPKHLSLLPNYNHALTPELDEQVFAWLDVYLKGAAPFSRVTPLRIMNDKKRVFAEWTYSGSRKTKSAELIISYGEVGNWRSRFWLERKAEITNNKCRVELPSGKLPYFASGTVIDKDGFRYSTPIVYVNPSNLKSRGKFDYDGCSLWGGFETNQITTCRLHGWPTPTIQSGAKEGKQCGVLKSGNWNSPPILGTAGVEHQLECWLRCKQPRTVTIALKGRGDGQKIFVEKKCQVDGEWRRFTIDYRIPSALTMSLFLAVSPAKGSEVMIDRVRFRPM